MDDTRWRSPQTCAACDLNDKPTLSAAGTMEEQQRDLHRAFHEMVREAADVLRHLLPKGAAA